MVIPCLSLSAKSFSDSSSQKTNHVISSEGKKIRLSLKYTIKEMHIANVFFNSWVQN